MRGVFRPVLLGLAAGIETVAHAQTFQAPQLSDFQAALDRANAASVSSNIAGSLPGYAGKAPDLQARASQDLSRLKADGADVSARNPIKPAIVGGNAYVASDPVSANTMWVKNALGIANDPTAAAAGSTGATSEACRFERSSHVEASLYSCESGNVIGRRTQTCQTFETIVSRPGTKTCQSDSYFDDEASVSNIGGYAEAHRCELYSGQGGLNVDRGCGVMMNQISAGTCGPPLATSQPGIYIEYCKLALTGVEGITYLGKRSDGCMAERADRSCTRTGSSCAAWIDEAAGLCGDETVTFTCGGAGYVDKGLDKSACASFAANPACVPQASTCIQRASDVPDIMAALSLTPDTCMRSSLAYACDAVTGTGSDCDVPSGCTLKSRTCLDPNADGSTPCQTYDDVYACQAEITREPVIQGSICNASWVNEGVTISAGDDPDNDLPEALSAINAMKAASGSYGSSSDLTIFSGRNLKCGKTIGGLSNCCKDSGLLLDNNLAACNADEKHLMAEQKARACHYVGTYCSNKSPFGCLTKKMSYCCYGSVLGRIVEEAGHDQLGLSWGDAKGPSCGGFSVAQFQRIDLTHVDFSDFYDDKLAGLANNDPNSTVAAIAASINAMNASGAASR